MNFKLIWSNEIVRLKWMKIKEWWSGLAARERKIFAFGSCAVVILVIYQFIWSPWLYNIIAMRERIKTNQAILVWMQSADQEIQKIDNTSGQQKIISPIILLEFLQKQINQLGLEKALTQLKQSGNETIEMHFQKVEFDQLIRLLLLVARQHVIISQATIVAEGMPGMVNADIVLKF
ncbi:MAG: hypothetical protein A3F11_04575 [Gammaproteobacteria bacterium RIFCSPHIGHO2_12_FULL_37_14]|nr:MAG: hypothetical protein A3F11_04575 [Gammaproteobacteria bacterium RIFCSPHIGHO2_12_FULL_37_14]